MGRSKTGDVAPPSDHTAATAEVLVDSAESLQDDGYNRVEVAVVAVEELERELEHPTGVRGDH